MSDLSGTFLLSINFLNVKGTVNIIIKLVILWMNKSPFPKQALVFKWLPYKSSENTVGKGEIARNKQFLLFPPCFLLVWITFCNVGQIWNCRLQTLSVAKSLKICRLGKG